MNHIVIRIVLSVIFTGIGLVGLVMPFLPGWVFFGFVLLLLFPDAPFTRSCVARIEQHFPSSRRLLRAFLPPDGK